MDMVIQFSVFAFLTLLVAFLTWRKCRQAVRSADGSKEYFLAGGNLSWIFIAGSITLTNINTDTFVGMNGSQTLMIAWWELSAVVGLILLAKIFLPIYYKYNCTTVTELLERRYDNKHIRAIVASVFLLGNVFLFLPVMLYTSSLLITTMFGLEIPLIVLASGLAAIGAAYAIFGGLRAVAVSDTYSGVIVLSLAIVIVIVSLNAIGWDFSGIPAERLTMIGDSSSPIPWTTLFTGMVFSQLYYWSTNQTITQRALAASSLREARKGVYLAAGIRLLIIPAVIAVPGVCAFKLYGSLGDATYGRLIADLLPHWLIGAMAAGMVAAAMTSFNSVLNSSATLYVCDLHQRYLNPKPNIARMSVGIQLSFTVLAIALVPAYMGAESIIQTIQQLLGLFSMPILSAFITGLLFRNVDARAVMATFVFGAAFYAALSFGWPILHQNDPSLPAPWHFLHLMFITVWGCVGFALLINRVVFGRRAEPDLAWLVAAIRTQ